MRCDHRNFLFRATVLGTLLIVAAIFAVGGDEQVSAPHKYDEADGQAKDVGPHKSLWVRTLDDAPGFWTAVLAGLTAVLAGVGVGQIYYLYRADETTRLTVDAALKAADAAEKSANVAELALIGAEAPFIFATAEGWHKGDPKAPGDQPGFGSFTLHNYGRSPAIVRDVYPGPVLSRGMPAPIGFPPPHTALHKTEIIPAGGHGEPFRLSSGAFDYPGWGTGAESDPEATHWIVGQVRYTDPFGTQYVTGFCFAHNPRSNRFYGQGGSAYNYRRRLNEEETRYAEAIDAGAVI